MNLWLNLFGWGGREGVWWKIYKYGLCSFSQKFFEPIFHFEQWLVKWFDKYDHKNGVDKSKTQFDASQNGFHDRQYSHLVGWVDVFEPAVIVPVVLKQNRRYMNDYCRSLWFFSDTPLLKSVKFPGFSLTISTLFNFLVGFLAIIRASSSNGSNIRD